MHAVASSTVVLARSWGSAEREPLQEEVEMRSRATILVLLALSAGACGDDLPPGLGDRAPDAGLEVIDATGSSWDVGETVRLSELGSVPVVLDFWASWCRPCLDQHRFVSDLVERYGSSIRVIGILHEDSPENARAWLSAQGATYPTVREIDATLESTFWVRGIPRFVLLDGDRRVAWDMMGAWGKDSVIARLDEMTGR